MMNRKDEFYVGYLSGVGVKTLKVLKSFVWMVLCIVVLFSLVFSLAQKPFKNSTFELTSETKITGVFYENPYPMLRVEVAENAYKNILLLGFGKSSVNPYLLKLRSGSDNLNGKRLTIEGNLIYYNGKTLIQITDEEKIYLEKDQASIHVPVKETISSMTLQGEVIDPKCYFGVMKPGYGKIHRSCAVRCISGGIPPVLATTDDNNISEYYLITNLEGQAINEDILPFVGKPSELTGIVQKMEDWYLLMIDTENIIMSNKESSIY